MRIEDSLFSQAANTQTALIEEARKLSFQELNFKARAFANELHRHGLQRGDRVAVFLDKSLEAVISFYAIWAAGGVVVPVNAGLKNAQVEHIVSHSQSVFFISTAAKLATLKSETLGPAGFIDAAGIFAYPDAAPLVLAAGAEQELAAILYTSGSTGLPKGVAVSHRNLVAGARIVAGFVGLNFTDRILSVLPFNFDYGLNQLLTSVPSGATLVLQKSTLPADICDSLVKYEITGLAGVPALWLQLLEGSSPFQEMQFPKLRYITNSGGFFPVKAILSCRQLIPHTRIFLMYGLTEAFRSTYLPPEEIDRRTDSIGKAVPESSILVLNSSGEKCKPGEIGELVHQGPTVALGYWRDAESSSSKFRPHPFENGISENVVYSGDLVRMDAEGYLYFVARQDEMIKSQGYRISPTEVEDLIFKSGLVDHVVVKSEPDEIVGQALVLHCVPKDATKFTPEILMAYCRREMPAYMLPKRIEIHASLPLGATGKIDRNAL